LYDKKKLPNKILFSGPKGTGKATLAYHLTNYIFSKKEEFPYDVNKFKINDLNKSYKLILNSSHPNFHLIDVLSDKKIIEISQIRQMINYANKTSFNNGERIVLIDNAENLNLNSLNALLKIVEEPNENIIFIIIFDNNKKILNTLKSRCLKFNLSLTFDQSIDAVNTIIKKNIYDLISKDLINHYTTTGDFINLINFSLLSKIDLSEISLKNFLINLIDDKHYKKDFFIKNNIYKYVEFYLLNLMMLKTSRNKINSLYKNFINKIHDLEKFNLDDESFFIEFKVKVLDE
jgi:DNA polymerase-3 subunit delta'